MSRLCCFCGEKHQGFGCPYLAGFHAGVFEQLDRLIREHASDATIGREMRDAWQRVQQAVADMGEQRGEL